MRNQPKAGGQLSYWKNYVIVDPTNKERLIDFASDIPQVMPFDIDYLSDMLRQFPEQALHSPHVTRLISFVRESEVNGTLPRGTFDKVLKALRIDYRGSKKKMSSQDLKQKIQENLSFFLKILNRGGLKLDEAIYQYIDVQEGESGELKGMENYRRIFKAYSKVYNKLISHLNHKEAIHFLEIAGRNVDLIWDYSAWTPDKRLLLYLKGGDMVNLFMSLKKG